MLGFCYRAHSHCGTNTLHWQSMSPLTYSGFCTVSNRPRSLEGSDDVAYEHDSPRWLGRRQGCPLSILSLAVSAAESEVVLGVFLAESQLQQHSSWQHLLFSPSVLYNHWDNLYRMAMLVMLLMLLSVLPFRLYLVPIPTSKWWCWASSSRDHYSWRHRPES